MKISVVIHTYNSEHYLRRCLESVRSFDEIVICDMYSSDTTLEIAAEFGCKVVYHEYTGGVPEPARNFAIQSASHEWVLVVDSDEVVPDTLRHKLYEFVEASGELYSGLRIARRNYFMGRFMHGSYPDYILRLMRKSRSNWPPMIHSSVQIDGQVAKLKARPELSFEHLDDPTMTQFIAKLNRYTDNERKRHAGKNYSALMAAIKIWYRFFRLYIVRGGFRDGKAGYVYAKLASFSKAVIMFKLWEDSKSR